MYESKEDYQGLYELKIRIHSNIYVSLLCKKEKIENPKIWN